MCKTTTIAHIKRKVRNHPHSLLLVKEKQPAAPPQCLIGQRENLQRHHSDCKFCDCFFFKEMRVTGKGKS